MLLSNSIIIKTSNWLENIYNKKKNKQTNKKATTTTKNKKNKIQQTSNLMVSYL